MSNDGEGFLHDDERREVEVAVARVVEFDGVTKERLEESFAVSAREPLPSGSRTLYVANPR